jgi:hypothetical protein
LFPNSKVKDAAYLKTEKEMLSNDHTVLYIGCPVEAAGKRAMIGFGVTLVGEADE